MIYQRQLVSNLDYDIKTNDTYQWYDEDECNRRLYQQIFLFIFVFIYDPIGQISLILSKFLEQKDFKIEIGSFKQVETIYKHKQEEDHSLTFISETNEQDRDSDFLLKLDFFRKIEESKKHIEEIRRYPWECYGMYTNILVSDSEALPDQKQGIDSRTLASLPQPLKKKRFIDKRQFEFDALLNFFNR